MVAVKFPLELTRFVLHSLKLSLELCDPCLTSMNFNIIYFRGDSGEREVVVGNGGELGADAEATTNGAVVIDIVVIDIVGEEVERLVMSAG